MERSTTRHGRDCYGLCPLLFPQRHSALVSDLPDTAWRIALEHTVADHTVPSPLGGVAPAWIVRTTGQWQIVHVFEHRLHKPTDAFEHVGYLAATTHLFEHLEDRPVVGRFRRPHAFAKFTKIAAPGTGFVVFQPLSRGHRLFPLLAQRGDLISERCEDVRSFNRFLGLVVIPALKGFNADLGREVNLGIYLFE